ncbi:MAG: formylmethanofuran dehydrogenase subunit A [Pirellulaceae bacterium]|nr:formylmethanofuran dehydrogenase subunit A [Pirellulaceae bacterium]
MIELANARIVDPLHPQNGQITSLFIDGDRFVAAAREPGVQRIDLGGAWVLAGGIDIHTHIGGGKVNLARLLMSQVLSPEQRTVWPTTVTGQKYARMGYTACFEPAMLLSSARHTHMELCDTPLLDHGAYVVLGNEDWLLELLGRAKLEDVVLRSLVGWSLMASRGLAVKVVNPGGINAFKFNQRQLDVDMPHVRYGVTPRQIIQRLSAAVDDLGLAHPLHLHASNLGMPGNIRATLQSLNAAEGRRVHLTHAQFHCYTDQGHYGMGSGAELLAEYVNAHPNVSLDVGQVLFGQTVTISADTMAQTRNLSHARPQRSLLSDIECQAGCGVVPIRYQDTLYVHSLQWTIGLELMLLVRDPWRIFLTTDHPNGGPFTGYPHLIRLLMDRSFRESMLERIHPAAAERSLLRELTRQYTLDEIAIVTRAAPARILGLGGMGSLVAGCYANLAAYLPAGDWETTFRNAAYVFKSGQPVIEDDQVRQLEVPRNRWRAQVDYDSASVNSWSPQLEQCLRLPRQALEICDDQAAQLSRATSVVHDCISSCTLKAT